MKATQLGRNDPCACGSGQKYKRCCATKDAAARSAELSAENAARAAKLAAEAEAEAQAAEGTEEGTDKTKPTKRPKLPTSHAGSRTGGGRSASRSR